MKYETSKDRQEIGIRRFIYVYYKNEFKAGAFKKLIKTYSICFAILLMLRFVFPGLKELIGLVILFLIGMVGLVALICTIGLIANKKQKLADNIIAVEHIFEEKYESVVNFKNGSVNKVQFNYDELHKIIEDKEFFFIFINEHNAIPLDKQSIDNIEEFLSFVKNKKIVLKEMKK